MRKNAVHKSMKTNFVRVKHVSGKVNESDILTKEDKDKAQYINLRDCLMYKLTIMGKVRHCIHIFENISVITTYGDRCHHNYPPKDISEVDITYNDFYTMISVVESKGGVAKTPDVSQSSGTSVRRPYLGLI